MTAPPPARHGGRIGLCVDSGAQLPADLLDRLPVEIVPLTLRIGEAEYLEGVDLSNDQWYDDMAMPSEPVEATAPSPGQFALAFESLLDRGCTEILSLHSAPPLCADPEVPACSGSVTAARLAAHRLGAPVRVLEVPTAGFGVGCCAWVAIDALVHGATLDEAAERVDTSAASVRQLFLAAPVEAFRRGAAIGEGASLEIHRVAGTPDRQPGAVTRVAGVATVLDAVNVMAAEIVTAGAPVRVAIGYGDPRVAPVAEALEFAVGETAVVDEVLRYRVGPSSSRLTGPGVVRCFTVPAAVFGPLG